jgi:hypothetical protein
VSLIVEDGTGKSDAESYASVTEVDSYATLTDTQDTLRDLVISLWNVAADSACEAALREATQYLDAHYFARWPGTKRTAAQALAWPRSGVIDGYGFAIADTVIPTALKRATAELALNVLNNTAASVQAAESGTLSSKSIAAGSVSLSQTFTSGGALTRPRYDRVDNLLRPILGSVGEGVVELRRA